MSLINDALKKAQKQRTGESPQLAAMPGIGGEPAIRIAKRAKPLGFNSLLLWIGFGAVTLVVVVAGGILLVRWMTAPPEAIPATRPAAVVTQASPVPSVTNNSAGPSATPEAPTATNTPAISPATAAVPPASAPIAVSEPVAEKKPVVITPAASAPELESPKAAAVALRLESKAIAYIEALRVAGIRASTTDSKVLMNDRVYRVGDTVEHVLGLKLAAIASNALTFEDERGARYTRNF